MSECCTAGPATALFVPFEARLHQAIEDLRQRLLSSTSQVGFSPELARQIANELEQSASRFGAVVEALAGELWRFSECPPPAKGPPRDPDRAPAIRLGKA